MSAQTKTPDAGGDPGLTKDLHSNSSEAQRRRLLDRLRIGAISTLDARRELDILMPAARIFELRDRGYRIDTLRINQQTDSGKQHNVARYVLQSSAAVASGRDALCGTDGFAVAQGASDGEA